LHEAGSEAAGTDFYFFGGTFDQGTNGSKIWAKHSLGAVVCMTDVIADLPFFPAHFT